MKQIIPLTEEDRKSLKRFYNIWLVWKWVLLIMITGFCVMLLYGAIVFQMSLAIWSFIIILLFGWFSFKENQKKLVYYEEDMQEDIKYRVTGRIIDFVFEESAQYITFCEDSLNENEVFLLTYKNDKQLGQVYAGAKVELEYTPYCHYLLSIQPL